jgi:hypothetical protein
MEALTQDHIRELLETQAAPCVTIYMPSSQAGQETLQNPTRLRNLVRDARGALLEGGMDEAEADRFLRPITDLTGDYPFWQHQTAGLAVFLSSGFFRHFHLPQAPRALALVGRTFHLRPLLPTLVENGRFYILAISQGAVDLYRATPYEIEEILLEDMPESMAEALRFDDPEQSLQHHGGAPRGEGQLAGIFHGHGSGKDEAKERLLRFFRQVDQGIRAYLRDQKAPLILAGVEYYFPLYREVNTYATLLPDGIPGSPKAVTDVELREQAWQRLRPALQARREEVLAALRAGLSKGLATTIIEDVVVAAHHGRIDACFVVENGQVSGSFDEGTARVQRHDGPGEGAQDLLDLAVNRTLASGGQVFLATPEEMPDSSPIAALMRY